MTRLIRNYQPGSQIVLSEHLRRHLADGGEAQIDEAELARQLRDEAETRLAEAEATLARAQAEADTLRRRAEEQIAIWQAEAQAKGFEAGYEQGIAEGMAVGEQTFVAGVTEVQAVLDAIQKQRSHLLLHAEQEVASLAMAIAEKVVGRLAQESRELILHTVNRALDELTISGPFTLRVHPADAAYLERSWRGVDSRGEAFEWKLAPDPTIERGGCVLICGPSTVDARLSSQLKSIVSGLALADYHLDSPAPAEPDAAAAVAPSPAEADAP